MNDVVPSTASMAWSKLHGQPSRTLVGLMSGSSCDGVDAALVRVEGTGRGLKAQLLAFETFPYDDAFRSCLLEPNLAVHDVILLNVEVGARLADAAQAMLEVARGQSVRVDAVASHGHTLGHIPPHLGARNAGTLQVGESAVIAERVGLPVISDFRARDMAAGGQGAPLVPYVDWLLFGGDADAVACLNIGGIANFTVVSERLEDVLAFDSGPGNMPIDGAVRRATNGRLHFDDGGRMAASGRVDEAAVHRLLEHPFLVLPPPKSTGREDFGPEVYLNHPALYGLAGHDLVATVTAAVGRTIVQAYQRFIEPQRPVKRLVVSGGGAHNRTLIDLLRDGLPEVDVAISDNMGWPADAREAVAFAILGNETLCGTPANVRGATGARHRVVLGKITPP